MDWTTLLTVVTDTDLLARQIDSGAALAAAQDAHLEVLCLGIDPVPPGYGYAGGAALVLPETRARAQEEAQALLAAARARLGAGPGTGRWSAEAAVVPAGLVAMAVGPRARFADLVLAPRPASLSAGAEHVAVVEAALFDGRAAVLIAPPAAEVTLRPRRVCVAWNQSDEALAAIRRALPILRQAETVDITVIDPPAHGAERSDPGGQLGQWLARHGARPEISVLARTLPKVSEVLRRHLRESAADLLVMGAYGHSRFREAILGGATRDMLETAEIPVLMAH